MQAITQWHSRCIGSHASWIRVFFVKLSPRGIEVIDLSFDTWMDWTFFPTTVIALPRQGRHCEGKPDTYYYYSTGTAGGTGTCFWTKTRKSSSQSQTRHFFNMLLDQDKVIIFGNKVIVWNQVHEPTRLFQSQCYPSKPRSSIFLSTKANILIRTPNMNP